MNFYKDYPGINDIANTDPLIICGVVLMALSIVIPCLIWFIRNLLRVVNKKDYWWFNNVIKISWGIGFFVFIIGLIILIVKLTTG